jgi:hypothetical protein
VEKARSHLALGDWDAALDTAQRCLSEDANCIPAHRIVVLHALTRVGNYPEAARKLTELTAAIESSEPVSHALFYQCSLAPTRLCGRHPLILQQSRAMLERAIAIDPNQVKKRRKEGKKDKKGRKKRKR